MIPIPYSIVDYCMYDYSVKKPTIIYNNFNLVLRTCDKSHNHIKWCDFSKNIYDRYVIPQKLCEEIINQIKI